MKFHEFVARVKKALEQETGKEVRIIENLKNNEVRLKGVCIRDSFNICPTIYLNSYYHQIEGTCEEDDIQETVRAVLEVYQEYKVSEHFDPEMLLDFDGIKDNICFKLLHYESNQTLLEDAVYEKVLDLAKVAYLPVMLPKKGMTGTILVTKKLCSFWEVEPEEILAVMNGNTAKIFPPVVSDMEDILGNDNDTNEWERNFPLYIASNKYYDTGSAVIFYEGFLQEFAEQIDDDFYILPSSIHEALFLPIKYAGTKDQVNALIRTENQKLPMEERLCDHAYLYKKDEDKLYMV